MNTFTRLPRVPMVGPRQSYLLRLCAGKRVLHLGCVDAGLLKQRVSTGVHLHQGLQKVCSHVSGIDIDAEGIQILREQGYSGLSVGDICDPKTFAPYEAKDFDIVLASEVVEHLSNPGLFLE